MTRQLVRGLCFVAGAVALVLQGCGKSSPDSLGRPVHSVAARAAVVDPSAALSAAHSGWKTSARTPVARARLEQHPTDDPATWLAELLHAPDPNVRIQALDAWAQHLGESLDP